MLGSDGIWDKLDNTEIVEITKNVYEEHKNADWYARGAEEVLL
jgi:serine/threonine protein phosphatase PrpC